MRSTPLRLSALALVVSTLFACKDLPGSSGPSGLGGTGGLAGSSSGDASSGSSGTARDGTLHFDVTNETLELDGKTRRYILVRPRRMDTSRTYPLVLSFHGNPGTADGMARGLPFESVSKGEAVVAYPAAETNDWDLYTPTDTNADMPFILALVDELENKAHVDKTRIFGFGYSGGSFFITQMACRFRGLFRAISVNAGGGPDEAQMGYGKRGDGCYVCPGGPVATIVTHGKDDPEVETASGEFTAACFAGTNGCGEHRSATSPAPCEAYDGCPSDKPVKRCIVPRLGHGVWGEAMKEAWTFFESLR